jgi:hypothetical protein
MKSFILASATLLTLFTACKDKCLTSDDGVYFQDFDNLKMWARDEWNLTDERAHSGRYAAHTDSAFQYSQTFEMSFNEAKSKGYKAIEVSAWVFAASDNAKAGVVASVESSSGTKAYETADLKNFSKGPNQWDKAIVFLKLPESAPEDAKIKVYLWSPAKSKVYIDDVFVQLHK